MNFRNRAKEALLKAKLELDSGEDSRLKYAALELRMALECLVYDTSKAYRDELSEEDFNTWQPKNLLEVMIEIDPAVDKNSEWRIGEQPSKGAFPLTMTSLGNDRRLSLKEIKKFYNRFGSYLHTPTIKQLEEEKSFDYSKLASSCKDLIGILEEVLSSGVYNTRMKSTSKITCEKCNSTIVRNIPPGQIEIIANCRNCGASYSVISEGNGKVLWKPRLTEFKCGGDGCSNVARLFDVEVKEGTCWDCKVCLGTNVICLGAVYEKPKKS